MVRLNCGHDTVEKVLRFSITDEEESQDGPGIAVISLCNSCWSKLLVVVNTATQPENSESKYFDGPKIVRVLDQLSKTEKLEGI